MGSSVGIAETKLDQSVQKCWMAMLATRGIQRGICWSALADYFRTFLSSGQTACHWDPPTFLSHRSRWLARSSSTYL